MCAFVVVVIIICAHFSNRLNAFVLHVVCIEAIVYHLHRCNYFINKILGSGLCTQGATSHRILFQFFFLVIVCYCHDLMFGLPSMVRLRGTLSVKFFMERKKILFHVVNLQLHKNPFDWRFFHFFSLHFFLKFFLHFSICFFFFF